MNSSGLVTQHDLLKWADSISARSELPRLIRRLVLETGDRLSSVDFPAGEGVSVGGWDGVVRAGGKAPFVPEGLSLWELSVYKAVNKKANEDYDKRLETPDGSPTAQATYCQLAVRRWADRRDWQTTKTRQGRWLAVRAFGVDDIETWLELAPVTHAWISEHLGLLPYGLRTAEAWWRTWSHATAPTLTPKIVLAGRRAQADELARRLRGAPQVISLSTGSPDEALAFIAALALEQDSTGAGDLLARTVFVDQLDTWRRLADTTKPLIMVPGTGELINEARSAPAHHVVVPLTTAARVDVELPPVDAAEAAAALKAAGLPGDRADAAGTLGRRNLLALRRNLAAKPELHQPTWARPPISRLVRGCLLAGTWHDSAPGDRDALARFVGRPYDELSEDLELLAAAADPLIIRVGGTWTVVSLFDAWRQLERQIRSDDLDRFREICVEALLERDPRFGMDGTDRVLASARGVASWRFSEDLRSGLAASLALLGVAGARVLPDGVANGSSYAQRIVRQLLAAANDDETGELLIGLAHHLDLLAEAAPDVFVEGIRAAIRGDQPLVLKMFQDHEGTDPLFSGGSAHTGLLWALETLAWSPEHFADAIYLLANLAEIDPGGRYSNRPQRSLREIFCPWHPETTATPSRRLAVLEEVGRRYPDAAWPLLLGLLPHMHGVHHPSSAPRFRDWKPEKSSVTQREFWEATEATADQAIEAAGTRPDRWAELVDRADALPPQKHQEVSFALRELVREGQLDEAGRHELWEKLRAHVARHREFSDSQWARSEEDLLPLDEVIEQIAPTDTLVAWKWLFTEGLPDLGEGQKNRGEDGYDHDAYTAALAERRRGAIAEILEQHGVVGAVRLAQSSGAAWWVGSVLAEIAPQRYDRELLDHLGEEDASRAFASGYFARRFAEDGWAAIDQAIADRQLSSMQHGRLLLCGDKFPEAWQRAADAGPEVTAVYWEGFSPYGLGSQFPHVAEAARRMLDHGSVAAALRMLALYVRNNDDIDLAPLVVEALDALPELDAAQLPEATLREYDFTTLFEFLESHRDTVGLQDVARLEWAYLPALGFEPSAPTLHEALAQNPSLFVGTLEIVYRPDESADAPRDLDEREQQMAQNGYQLLDSWHRPPGKNADGSFDGAALREWVDAALAGADAVDRRRSAERQIGRMLRYTPPEQDGVWPNEPVRDLLEALDSDRIDDALAMEVYNSRGVTSRNPTDGGEQERALAESYRAHIADFADRWPRSAAMLRGLAEDYEVDGRQHDAEAERIRGGLDR